MDFFSQVTRKPNRIDRHEQMHLTRSVTKRHHAGVQLFVDALQRLRAIAVTRQPHRFGRRSRQSSQKPNCIGGCSVAEPIAGNANSPPSRTKAQTREKYTHKSFPPSAQKEIGTPPIVTTCAYLVSSTTKLFPSTVPETKRLHAQQR